MDGIYKEQIGSTTVYRWKIFDPWKKQLNTALTTRLTTGHNIDNDREQIISAITAQLSTSPVSWAYCKQVHGINITALSDNLALPFENCDGILVDKIGCLAAIFLADCHPVVIYDPITHRAAIGHAGWKGTLAGIARDLVKRMILSGSQAKDLWAACGPGIGPCCYTVGEDVADLFAEKFKGNRQFPTSKFLTVEQEDRKWKLNLEAVNKQILIDSDVPPEQIGCGEICTACQPEDFFSYRVEGGTTGRQAAVLLLI